MTEVLRKFDSPLNLHLMTRSEKYTSSFCTRASCNICSRYVAAAAAVCVLLKLNRCGRALGYGRHRAIGVVTRCPRTHGACQEISTSLLRAPKRYLASSRHSRSLHACQSVRLTRDHRRKLSAPIADSQTKKNWGDQRSAIRLIQSLRPPNAAPNALLILGAHKVPSLDDTSASLRFATRVAATLVARIPKFHTWIPVSTGYMRESRR